MLFRWNKSLLTFCLLDLSVTESCWTKFHGQKILTGYSPWSRKSQTWLNNWAQHNSLFLSFSLQFFHFLLQMFLGLNTLILFSLRNCVCNALFSSLIFPCSEVYVSKTTPIFFWIVLVCHLFFFILLLSTHQSLYI